MFVVTNGNQKSLFNLDEATRLYTFSGGLRSNEYVDNAIYEGEDYNERFDDIVEALEADTLKVYDSNNPVGYWKKGKPQSKPQGRPPKKTEG